MGGEEEINLTGRYLKLSTGAMVSAVAALIAAAIWCRDVTNRLEQLTAQMQEMNKRIDASVADRYTGADARRDFGRFDPLVHELRDGARDREKRLTAVEHKLDLMVDRMKRLEGAKSGGAG